MHLRTLGVIVLVAGLGRNLTAGDWPQWRGINRTGIAPTSPALAEAWPKEGPKKLWESETIPSREQGGFASAVVVGDRAYVYANWRFTVPVPFRVVPDHAVRQLGWTHDQPPAAVVKAMEQARLSEARAALKPEEVRPWATKWVTDNVDEETRKRFGGYIGERLIRGKDAIDLRMLDKLATIRDKEVPSQEELDKWFAACGTDPAAREHIMKQVATTRAFSRDAIVCLNVADGKTAWKAEFPSRVYGWASSSSPCVAGNRLYAAGGSDAYCLDTASGKEIWRTWLPGGEISSSFLLVENTAIILAGVLCGLDPDTGERRWVQDKVRGNNSSPVVWQKEGTTCVLVNSGGETACVNAKTGALLWVVPGGGSCTPGIEGDFAVVFAERGDLGLSGYKLSLAGAEKAWTVPIRDRGASPIIHKGHVYTVGGGKTLCVKLDSGQIVWEQPTPGEISSPLLADGKILAFTNNGVVLFKATEEKYVELARGRIPFSQCSSPSFADGKLFIRENERVTCYDITSAANPAPPAATTGQ